MSSELQQQIEEAFEDYGRAMYAQGLYADDGPERAESRARYEIKARRARRRVTELLGLVVTEPREVVHG